MGSRKLFAPSSSVNERRRRLAVWVLAGTLGLLCLTLLARTLGWGGVFGSADSPSNAGASSENFRRPAAAVPPPPQDVASIAFELDEAAERPTRVWLDERLLIPGNDLEGVVPKFLAGQKVPLRVEIELVPGEADEAQAALDAVPAHFVNSFQRVAPLPLFVGVSAIGETGPFGGKGAFHTLNTTFEMRWPRHQSTEHRTTASLDDDQITLLFGVVTVPSKPRRYFVEVGLQPVVEQSERNIVETKIARFPIEVVAAE